MELFRHVGKTFDSFTFEDLLLEREGFLSLYSFGIVGIPHRLELMERGTAAVVLPVDFENRIIYLIQQPRHVLAFASVEGQAALTAAKQGEKEPAPFTVPRKSIAIFELAAGVIEPGETPEEAAVRELQEETGFVIDEARLQKVGVYHPSAGESTLLMHAYIAHLPNPPVSSHTDGDGSESIDVWKMSFEEAWEMMRDGRIRTASSMILLRELKIIDLERSQK